MEQRRMYVLPLLPRSSRLTVDAYAQSMTSIADSRFVNRERVLAVGAWLNMLGEVQFYCLQYLPPTSVDAVLPVALFCNNRRGVRSHPSK